jgi:uncharacterized membrane protein
VIMQPLLADVIARWSALYSGHAVLRTLVVFAHIGALVGAGGCAIAADRGTLLASRADAAEQRAQVEAIAGTHRVVIGGLSLILVSGLLMLAADLDTFLHSRVFWIKMGLVVLLLINGAVLTAAERRARRGDERTWGRLRSTAMASLALWLLIAFAGVGLTNVG